MRGLGCLPRNKVLALSGVLCLRFSGLDHRLHSCSGVDMASFSVKTINEGDGKTFPKMGEELTMHYTGRLTDGQVVV